MSTNEKKWWESTGGILSIISILLTIFLSWDSCSEKLFGKYSTSSLVGTWTFTDTDEHTMEGMGATMIATFNGETEFKKKGRFYKKVDITVVGVVRGGLFGSSLQNQTITLNNVTSEGKYEIIDENIRFIVERTNYEQKVIEQIGDSQAFKKLFQGMMKNHASESKIVKLKGNSMILDNLEGTDKITYMKKN